MRTKKISFKNWLGNVVKGKKITKKGSKITEKGNERYEDEFPDGETSYPIGTVFLTV